MDAKRICPYCMQELDAPEPVCPHCGRSLTGRNPSGSLPVGTVLAGLLSLVMILVKMKKYYGLYPEFRGFLVETARNNAVMVLSTAGVLGLKRLLPSLPGLIAIGVYGLACAGLFVALAFLFRAKALKVRL